MSLTPHTEQILLAMLEWDRQRVAPLLVAHPEKGAAYIARQAAAAVTIAQDPPATWSQEVREFCLVLLENAAHMLHGRMRIRTVGVGRVHLPPAPSGLTMPGLATAAEEIGVLGMLRVGGMPEWREGVA